MRHIAMTAAAMALSAAFGADVMTWKGAVTEGYFDDPENWSAGFSLSNSNQLMRVSLSDKTDQYRMTVTNRMEFMGAADLHLNGEVAGITLDVSNGVFTQVDGGGTLKNDNSGLDPFCIRTGGYSVGPLYLSPSSRFHRMYYLSNTVFFVSRTKDANDDFVFDLSFTGGRVSFAEPAATNTVTVIQSASSPTDQYSNYLFDGVDLTLPIFKMRGGKAGGLVHFKGGRCEVLGDTDLYAMARAVPGTAEFRVSDGAQVTHRGHSLTIGAVAGIPSNTNLVVATGAGTKYSMVGVGNFNGYGISYLRAENGATLEFGKLPAKNRYYYFGRSPDSATHLVATGAGSSIDATGVGSFCFLGRSTLTVENGGTFLLPTTTSLGTNDILSNDVVVVVRDEGSRAVVPANGTVNVGERIAANGSTRATINVEGGVFGAELESSSFVFCLGRDAGCVGVVNVSGGLLRGGKGNNVSVGYLGAGELNVSGGSVYVDKTLDVGACASTDGTACTYRQTGGHVYTGDGMRLCANAGNASANTRRCDAYLLGGVLEASTVYGGAGRSGGLGGSASVHADGGTLKATVTRTGAYPFICSCDLFEIGAGGLVVDTAGFDELVTQNMTDAAGAAGVLMKVGAGELIYESGAYSVSTTVVARGTLSFRDAAPNFSTALVVTNGSTLSMAGTAASLSLRALALDGATLNLDLGDVIEVSGPVSLRNLTLAISAAPASGESSAFLVCNGELDADTIAELRRAYCAVAHAEGYHGAFDVVYDSETGKTTVSYASRENGAPLSGDAVTEWHGASDAWSVAANWSNGLPDAAKKAVFADAAAESAVTAPAGAVVGALSLGADDVTLGGSQIEIAAEEGAAEIEVTAGSAKVEAPLLLDAGSVAAKVAAGSELELAGGVTYGGIAKTGAGRLVLSGAGDFRFPSSFEGGTTVLADAAALGGAVGVSLQGGTLATTAPGTAIPYATMGSSSESVQIVKTDSDATIAGCDVTGCFIKRGAGRLTLDFTGIGSQRIISTVKGTGSNGLPADSSHAYSFPSDGSAPDGGFVGFTVAEGELVLKDDPATHKQHKINVQQLLMLLSNLLQPQMQRTVRKLQI